MVWLHIKVLQTLRAFERRGAIDIKVLKDLKTAEISYHLPVPAISRSPEGEGLSLAMPKVWKTLMSIAACIAAPKVCRTLKTGACLFFYRH